MWTNVYLKAVGSKNLHKINVYITQFTVNQEMLPYLENKKKDFNFVLVGGPRDDSGLWGYYVSSLL